MIKDVKILKTELLSDNWYILKKLTYEYLKKMAHINNRPEKFTIEGMVLQFYFTILLSKQ